MKKNKITVALDKAIDSLGYDAGYQVSFRDGLPSFDDGLAFFNCSIDDQSNTSSVYWTNSNETNNQTVVASLAVDAVEEFWFWSTGTNCIESGAGDDTETLKVWYTDTTP